MTNYRWFCNGFKEKKTLQIFIIGFYMLIALGLSGFHIYTSNFGVFEAWFQRAVHLALVLIIAYTVPFVKMAKKNEWKTGEMAWYGALLAGSIAYFAYVLISYPAIQMRQGIPNNADKLMCLLLVVLLVIGSLMYIGWPIPILVTVFVIYSFAGPYMPWALRHRGFSVDKVVDQLFISISGIFGPALGASAVFIAIFIIFCNFLIQTKVGDYLIDFATAFTGQFVGGPAKVAVVSSALMGTIHGSGPGNVATTGSFTIPLMKRLGYRPEFAGAVEASASTGGIIMPPVMGATAFVMAEMTRIPYSRIMFAAIIPAVLYFGSIFFMVHLEAKKQKLNAVPKEEMPDIKVVRQEIYLLLPVFGIIVFLVRGFSPMKAGLYAIILTVVISMFRKKTRLNLERAITALEEGSSEIITIALACGAAGIVAGLIALTGLGVKLSVVISTVAGGSLFIALIMTMIVCIILGMGMPVTAAFILVAATTSPLIIKMGVSVLATNMFVFYFATVSAITPPVALSTYTAAGIAGSDMNKTGWEAVKLALAAFIVPFMFVYSPPLLWEGTTFEIIRASITALIGVVVLAIAVHGWNLKGPTHPLLRAVLFVLSFFMIDSGLITDLIGIAGIAVVYMIQKMLYKKSAKTS